MQHSVVMRSSDSICTRDVLYAVDFFHEAFHLTSISTDLCVNTVRDNLLVHSDDDLAHCTISYCFWTRHRLSLYASSQKLATVGFRSLCWHWRNFYCCSTHKCSLGPTDFAHSIVLHIEASNANVAKNRSGNGLHRWDFVSFALVDQPLLSVSII